MKVIFPFYKVDVNEGVVEFRDLTMIVEVSGKS